MSSDHSSSASILCMALLSLLHTTKVQYRKTVNCVFSETLTYPSFFPKRWKELTQIPGQEHTDSFYLLILIKGCNLVTETQKVNDHLQEVGGGNVVTLTSISRQEFLVSRLPSGGWYL